MSLRELEVIAREYRNVRDVTLIRKDVNLYQSDIKKESAPFLTEIDKISKKEKKSRVAMIALISEE
jgi:hypothetical protein